MPVRKTPQGILLTGTVVALVVFGAVLVALDWREVRRVIAEANWEMVLPALLATAVSYACLSYGFALVCRIFKIPIPQRSLVEIGFVSITLNHLMATGGVAGLSLRLLLMKRRGLELQHILAASLFHSYFNNLAMLLLLPAGLLYVLMTHSLSTPQYVGVAMVTVVLVVILGFATVVVFVAPARAVTLRLVGHGWRILTRHDVQGSFANFDHALAMGIVAIRAYPYVLVLPILLIIGDWTTNVVALWFCFDALGHSVGPGILLTGFVIGITVGLISFVPGGLGIQEGSMVGVYTFLGVPFEQAVLASVLFRVVYYFIPFGISLVLYRRLLRSIRQEVA